LIKRFSGVFILHKVTFKYWLLRAEIIAQESIIDL
jgi:hypothetical protein